MCYGLFCHALVNNRLPVFDMIEMLVQSDFSQLCRCKTASLNEATLDLFML